MAAQGSPFSLIRNSINILHFLGATPPSRSIRYRYQVTASTYASPSATQYPCDFVSSYVSGMKVAVQS